MFNLFKKSGQKNIPLTINHKYFIRVANWDWLNEDEIHIKVPNVARVLTVDPWPQLVFLEADGQRTVTEFIKYMAAQYENGAPEGLEETIIDQIQALLAEKVLELSDTPRKLDPKHEMPQSAQENT
jgi:hypothetical protein